MKNITMPTLNQLVVGETLKLDFTITQAFTPKDRIMFAQFAQTNTGSTLKIKVWIEY